MYHFSAQMVACPFHAFSREPGSLSDDTQLFSTQETYVSDTDSISDSEYNSEYEAIASQYDIPARVEGVHNIAHSSQHLQHFSKLHWGVTYEIHRWISAGKITFDELDPRKVTKLTGSDAVAVPKAVDVLLGGKETMPAENDMEHHSATKSPWAAMDLEREKLKADPLAGLGVSAGERWYGGTVHFTGTLDSNKMSSHLTSVGRKRSAPITQPTDLGGDGFRIILNSPEVGPSCRFARRYGSESFFCVRIPKALRDKYKDDTLQRFFASNKFVIAGRTFRAFYEDGNSVHMVITNEPYEGNKVAPPPYTEALRPSLWQFINDHNDPANNSGQTMAKWRARFKLGLSDTEPAMRVPKENIHFCKDITVSSDQAATHIHTLESSFRNPEAKDKTPAHEIMTDGCGLINYAGLKMITSIVNPNFEGIPVVFQVRIGGYKGLLLLDPTSSQEQDKPHIWLVDSQRKIVFDDSPHDSHLIIDVVRPPHFAFPSSLSKEVTINLAHNKVPNSVFKKLFDDNLRESTAERYEWSTNGSRLKLSHAVAVAGDVIRGKIARVAGGAARARGLVTWNSKDSGLIDDEAESNVETAEDDPLSWDPSSGRPSNVFEVVKVMLDCGFTPTNSVYLREKLKCVLNMIIARSLKKLKIPLKYSAEAFAVPDFWGQLKPGTIFVKSSTPLPMPDGMRSNILLGDALVVRHPCKTPSDIQKVRAVAMNYPGPGFHHFKNVAMFSTKGQRSPMSYLGGGDYDGDTVIVIWDPDLVNSFVSPDSKFADPPRGKDFVKCFPTGDQNSADLPKSLDDCFQKDKEDVAKFLERTRGLGEGAKTFEMQKHLMNSLAQESMVGICSNLHDRVAYRYGYGSHQAWLLAYLFTTCLDGVKTGKVIRPEILRRATSEVRGYLSYGREMSMMQGERAPPDNEHPIKYFTDEATFVMDDLVDFAKKSNDLRLGEWHKLFPREAFTPNDADLLEPWNEAHKRGESNGTYSHAHKQTLGVIEHHVKSCMEDFYDNHPARGTPSSGGRTPETKASAASKRKASVAFERKASAAFWSGLPEEATAILGKKSGKELAASTAYKLDERHARRFAFCVAFRDLCDIKAHKVTDGRCVTVKQETYEYLTVSSLARKYLP